MTTKTTVWTEPYKIASHLVNLQGRAGLYSVLNLIQDVGFQHARGVKIEIAERHLPVFTRQKLVMSRWPRFNEVLSISTWLRPIEKQFVSRDYELRVGEELVGSCTASFTFIDAGTRRIAQLAPETYAKYTRTDYRLGLEARKLPVVADLDELAEFEVRNSDIDLNNHVNNTRYAQWLLDAVPIDRLRTTELHEYEVNFLAETRLGDRIAIFGREDATTGVMSFQGMRKADGKAAFTALMKASRKSGWGVTFEKR